MFLLTQAIDDLREIGQQYFANDKAMLELFEEELLFAKAHMRFQDEDLYSDMLQDYLDSFSAEVASMSAITSAPKEAKSTRMARYFPYVKSWAERKAKEIAYTVPEQYAKPEKKPHEDMPELVKRAVLVAKFEKMWPTIEADLNQAAVNGLNIARPDPDKKVWNVEKALEWASSRAKLQKKTAKGTTAYKVTVRRLK